MIRKTKKLGHYRQRADGDFDTLLAFAKRIIRQLDSSFPIEGSFFGDETFDDPYVSQIRTLSFGTPEQGFRILHTMEFEPKHGGLMIDSVLLAAFGLPDGLTFSLESARKVHDPPYLKLVLCAPDEVTIQTIFKEFLSFFKVQAPLTKEELEYELLRLNAAVHNNAWSSVKKLARIILKDYPENTKALFGLGVAVAVEGKLEKAIAYLQQVLAKEPEHYDAWYNLGICFFRQQKLAEALHAFEESLKVKPENHAVFWMLGQTHEKLGSTGLALKAYQAVVRTNPNPDGLGYTGKNFTELAKKAIENLNASSR